MTIAAATVEPSLIFQSVELGTRRRFEVHAILGKRARYEVRIDGKVELTITATRAWRSEQKQAIQWAQRELGYKGADGQPNVGQAAVIATGPKPVSGIKRARMAALWADIARDKGYAELPERLLELGREHAKIWSDLGRASFDNEMARLQAERCEQEEEWDASAQSKVTYY